MDQLLEILYSIRPEMDFQSSKDFFADGLLDSFDLVALVSTLDHRYHISIEGTDIIPENFGSLECLAALLKKYEVTI